MAASKITKTCVICQQERPVEEVFESLISGQPEFGEYCTTCKAIEQTRRHYRARRRKERRGAIDAAAEQRLCACCRRERPLRMFSKTLRIGPGGNWCSECLNVRAEKKREWAKELGLRQVCILCGEEFPATTEFFYPHPKMRYGLLRKCRKCACEHQKNHNRKYAKGWRRQVLLHYSGGLEIKCACCGESKIEFMTLDHISGGGGKERLIRGNGEGYYLWLIRRRFPEGLQVLCFNCNWAKHHYGTCPHEQERATKQQ